MSFGFLTKMFLYYTQYILLCFIFILFIKFLKIKLKIAIERVIKNLDFKYYSMKAV